MVSRLWFFIGSCLSLFLLSSCDKKVELTPQPETLDFSNIRALDLSDLPKIRTKGIKFYNRDGKIGDMLFIAKSNGINTVRLKVWVNPYIQNQWSNMPEVAKFSTEIKKTGMKVWLTVHYSDTWADPGKQVTPKAWQNLPIAVIKDSVYNYTKKLMTNIKPDYIQIGNEINNGFMHPNGNINSILMQFIALMQEGIKAVRDQDASVKVIMHYAGIDGLPDFMTKTKNLDYDIVGLSYYPMWHGKDMSKVTSTIQYIADNYSKKVIIAETSYPFTLGYNDYTNNIVGLESQLILPQYPATPEGQHNFISDLYNITKSSKNCLGLCYWGGELVAYDGPKSQNGSPYENQAVFDFNNKALPVLEVFGR